MVAILKLDLRRKYRLLYNPSPRAVSVVDVPLFNFLMIDGSGDPNNSAEYEQALNALYSASYTLKFMLKKSEKPVDYPVMALEGLWWTVDDSLDLSQRDNWRWTMMIMQPEFITKEQVAQALEQAAKKKDVPALGELRFEPFHEGLSAQIMHLGSYSTEPPTIAKLHGFIAENGYHERGSHHEIYLGDPNRTAPERLKTILRHPIT